MIKVGARLFVLPSHSMKFGGRWGTVKAIDVNSDLPIRVRIDGMNNLYGFSQEELTDKDTFKEWIKPGTKVLDKSTGEVSYVSRLYKDVVNVDGDEVKMLVDLLPYHNCVTCGDEVLGLFEEQCEECLYPLMEEEK